MPTLDVARKEARQQAGKNKTNANLSSRGGSTETAPRLYLVFYGNQWASDPSGEAAYLQNFYAGLYGTADAWSTSTTQYCQGVPSGTVTCPTTATFVGHPANSPLAGVWFDNAAAAPSSPTQANLPPQPGKAARHSGR